MVSKFLEKVYPIVIDLFCSDEIKETLLKDKTYLHKIKHNLHPPFVFRTIHIQYCRKTRKYQSIFKTLEDSKAYIRNTHRGSKRTKALILLEVLEVYYKSFYEDKLLYVIKNQIVEGKAKSYNKSKIIGRFSIYHFVNILNSYCSKAEVLRELDQEGVVDEYQETLELIEFQTNLNSVEEAATYQLAISRNPNNKAIVTNGYSMRKQMKKSFVYWDVIGKLFHNPFWNISKKNRKKNAHLFLDCIKLITDNSPIRKFIFKNIEHDFDWLTSKKQTRFLELAKLFEISHEILNEEAWYRFQNSDAGTHKTYVQYRVREVEKILCI